MVCEFGGWPDGLLPLVSILAFLIFASQWPFVKAFFWGGPEGSQPPTITDQPSRTIIKQYQPSAVETTNYQTLLVIMKKH